jgi:hypothetical protein
MILVSKRFLISKTCPHRSVKMRRNLLAEDFEEEKYSSMVQCHRLHFAIDPMG